MCHWSYPPKSHHTFFLKITTFVINHTFWQHWKWPPTIYLSQSHKKQVSSVVNSFEMRCATFSPKSAKKAPLQFLSKRATILVKGATISEFFYWWWSSKWPTIPFLLHFYVTISPRAMQDCENIQILIFFDQNDGKLCFFYAPQYFFGATRNAKNATLALKRHY